MNFLAKTNNSSREGFENSQRIRFHGLGNLHLGFGTPCRQAGSRRHIACPALHDELVVEFTISLGRSRAKQTHRETGGGPWQRAEPVPAGWDSDVLRVS